MRSVTVAATQMACGPDARANADKAEEMVREAAARGADVVLLQELFEGPYFCSEEHVAHFRLAQEAETSPLVARFSSLARELGCVLPVSFFERAGNAHYNSMAMVDADGRVLGLYRKSHIPDGPGYKEKYYFSPGDTGFRAWDTAHGCIGVGICWDQWFPEGARAMALQGAEMLLYPTAIGSEPADPSYDSSRHWRNVMRGHAAANIVPVVASNRVGAETNRDGTEVTFYGTSFIADHQGEVVSDLPRGEEGITTASFDLDAIRELRTIWGLFRDRRPDLYGSLLTLDGQTRAGP